ncbi:Predicted dehydrogenase [Algibacter lectus]|uniref:Gfo/Idh/MocA family protein n=1 Tax=Algibacter lectus TaxID=221126 RepID=UPI0008DEB2A3|nr:Gfo/Idh/MocA family oxidoreductase [Algibacter lectus]SFB96384.1 Predicted dehydrogenase [Algibacter lectus]
MDRRKFLRQGGAASAALATSTSVLANVGFNFNSSKTINIGVIGTGDRGSGLIPFINEIEHLNVYACCDVIPFRLEKGLARTKGKAKGYINYKDLLNDKAIDAVVIATTFSEHSKIAMDAVDAGKHVYCEKTLAKGYQGIHDLVAKVKQSNIIFQTGHQYHSSRLYTHVVKLIKEGKVGNISAFECQWNRHSTWRRPVPDPSLEKAINWRMYRETSGGLIAELCSHQIDFVNTVLEENPLQVMGIGGIDYYKDGRETFDNIHLIYTYPNGIEAKFSCILNNAKDGYQIKVIGDKGTLIITTSSAKFYPESKKKAKASKLQDVDGVSGATWQADDKGYGEPINISHQNPSKQALTDFRNSILDNKEPVSNIITGSKAAICVQMGLDAMYNNEIVLSDSKFEM